MLVTRFLAMATETSRVVYIRLQSKKKEQRHPRAAAQTEAEAEEIPSDKVGTFGRFARNVGLVCRYVGMTVWDKKGQQLL
jgi:hypothetical protein